MKDSSVKSWSAFHRRLYRLTGGLIGGRLVDNDMLLLTTRGRTSGLRHTVPLLYLPNDVGYVVIASYGGRPRHPDWYLNLTAPLHPEAEVQVKGRTERVVARTATAEERAIWWPRVVASYDGYREYQQKTDREIPVVFLDPIERIDQPTG
jgi:deazaflavin-dependent oxidoreductase (nitroreductase family)